MKKVLFVHIPKTGGMTIRHGVPSKIHTAGSDNHISRKYTINLADTMHKAGEHHGFEHARWRDWREDLRENHDAVAVVRNPWERVVSRYTFAQIANDKSGDQSFEDFLDERTIYGGRDLFWHRAIRGWYPQKDYVTDEAGMLQVDCLRFGTRDLVKYFDLLEPLPRRNVSNIAKLDYRDFYTIETAAIVADWYRDDLEFFGFTFDGGATRNVWINQ